MSNDIEVYYEATPNPASMKFTLTDTICDQTINFTSSEETQNSPLAAKLFGFPWCAGVFIGPQFVTITKQDWVNWDVIAEPLSNLLKEHLQNKEPVLIENKTEQEDENDSPIVKQIKKVFNDEIRPAVAMDGGDIIFHKYEDEKVYVFMQGACSGCPSSTMTLKAGIEARLQEIIPEVKEVISM